MEFKHNQKWENYVRHRAKGYYYLKKKLESFVYKLEKFQLSIVRNLDLDKFIVTHHIKYHICLNEVK